MGGVVHVGQLLQPGEHSNVHGYSIEHYLACHFVLIREVGGALGTLLCPRFGVSFISHVTGHSPFSLAGQSDVGYTRAMLHPLTVTY